MYGWRGKFGFVTPSISDTVLMEFYRMLPEGVLVTTVDLKIQNLVDEEFGEAMDKIDEAVKILDYEEVEAIIVGGTPPITKMGFDAESKIIDGVQSATGKPASTTPTAEVGAMKALGLKRIGFVSPYQEPLHRHLEAYLEHAGFEVIVSRGLDIVKNVHLTQQNFHRAYMVAKEAFLEVDGEVDGLFITCPRWPVVRCIDALERDLGVPVVSSAQALVWKALSMLNIREVRAGYGKLFAGFEAEV